jgi:hypothetical protein
MMQQQQQQRPLWLWLLVLTHLWTNSIGLSLSPITPPEQIVAWQLQALQADNMKDVFDYASPNNQANAGNSLERFSSMVRSGPYKPLIHHASADILLTRVTPDVQWLGLVRVVGRQDEKKSEQQVSEFWWLLSKCDKGEFVGCYMVDAVIPHM